MRAILSHTHTHVHMQKSTARIAYFKPPINCQFALAISPQSFIKKMLKSSVFLLVFGGSPAVLYESSPTERCHITVASHQRCSIIVQPAEGAGSSFPASNAAIQAGGYPRPRPTGRCIKMTKGPRQLLAPDSASICSVAVRSGGG